MQKEFSNFSRDGELRAIPESAPSWVKARILEIRSKMKSPKKKSPAAPVVTEPEVDREQLKRKLQLASL